MKPPYAPGVQQDMRSVLERGVSPFWKNVAKVLAPGRSDRSHTGGYTAAMSRLRGSAGVSPKPFPPFTPPESHCTPVGLLSIFSSRTIALSYITLAMPFSHAGLVQSRANGRARCQNRNRLDLLRRRPDAPLNAWDCADKVEMILRSLGLYNAKDTIVGNNSLRGVSGGERRRVTLGKHLRRLASQRIGSENGARRGSQKVDIRN